MYDMNHHRWLKLLDWLAFASGGALIVGGRVWVLGTHSSPRLPYALAHASQEGVVPDDRIPFAIRTTQEQQLISRMRLPDRHYNSFRAILHNHLVDSEAGDRIRVAIAQPDAFKVWGYAADTDAAPLTSVSAGWKGLVRMYSVGQDVRTTWQQLSLDTQTTAAPHDARVVVDGFSYPEMSTIDRATTPKDLLSRPRGLGAVSFLLQPANFAYGYIPHSHLRLESTTYEGRRVTTMHLDWQPGHSRTEPGVFASANSGPIILWVDDVTGIILRIEVYNGPALAGWAAFSDVHINEPTDDIDFQSDDAPASVPLKPLSAVYKRGRHTP